MDKARLIGSGCGAIAAKERVVKLADANAAQQERPDVVLGNASESKATRTRRPGPFDPFCRAFKQCRMTVCCHCAHGFQAE